MDAFTFGYSHGGNDYLIYKPDQYDGMDYTQGGFVGLTTDATLAAAVVDNMGNPLFLLVSPTVGQFIDSLIAACQTECGEFGINPNNECNLILTMLQNDLMLVEQYLRQRAAKPRLQHVQYRSRLQWFGKLRTARQPQLLVGALCHRSFPFAEFFG